MAAPRAAHWPQTVRVGAPDARRHAGFRTCLCGAVGTRELWAAVHAGSEVRPFSHFLPVAAPAHLFTHMPSMLAQLDFLSSPGHNISSSWPLSVLFLILSSSSPFINLVTAWFQCGCPTRPYPAALQVNCHFVSVILVPRTVRALTSSACVHGDPRIVGVLTSSACLHGVPASSH